MLEGEVLYTDILEANLCAFDYRLFHEDFSPIYEAPHKLDRNLHEIVYRQMQIN